MDMENNKNFEPGLFEVVGSTPVSASWMTTAALLLTVMISGRLVLASRLICSAGFRLKSVTV